MPQKKNFSPIFFALFIFAVFLFFLSRSGVLSGVTGFFEQATLPLQRSTFDLFHKKNNNNEDAKLRAENTKLNAQLVDKLLQERENQALRDQFATTYPKSSALMPAKIVGILGQEMVIDKGEKDGVRKGLVAVFKNNLVGTIVKTSQRVSVVAVIIQDAKLTAKTLKTESQGIVDVQGGNLVLDKVDLSDKLEKDDFVLTKGDIQENGKGFPPDLVIGKIVSVNKKSSNIFQSASVKSLVDFSRLEMVFVMTQ